MIHLYPLEEHPHFCSFYWGGFNGNSTSASSSISAAASTNYDGTLRSGLYEDPRIEYLRKLSYGIALPIICALGIVGNVLNLVVLTRRNMRGTAYIYMRGDLVFQLFLSLLDSYNLNLDLVKQRLLAEELKRAERQGEKG
ncbi:AAEL004189-PA [Aedes aegypti]|uniref:AAEL004189-PA n=1 Tax=Aedes aegypti TaxID=7159 RepID=Q0IFQ1_AEDAE|nr:AAEL004189-PA [Aedes aegypti]